MWFIRILIFLVTLKTLNCAKILAIGSVPSYSHHLVYRAIWLELAKKGHNITLLTTDLTENAPSNLRQIDWNFAYHIRHEKYNLNKKILDSNFNIFPMMKDYQNVLLEIADEELSHPEVKKLINNEDEQFDLVMTEYLPVVMSAFSKRFNCPYITLFSADTSNFYHRVLGNSIHPILYPDFMSKQHHLNFQDRLFSSFYHLYLFVTEMFYSPSEEDMVVKKHFGENYPPLKHIMRNVSMVFVNIHPIFNVKPLGPGFLRIGGGIHWQKKKKLPQEVQEFLDSAVNGAIYFSLGTNVRSKYVPKTFLKTIIDVFNELPFKIIWKFETDIPELSNNTKIFKWLPQQDILRHQNIKLFISQCGLQSLEESILAEVPILAIPFLTDQKVNSVKTVELGIGLELDRNTITKEIMHFTIMEMMTNSSYQSRIKEVSNLMLDQPIPSLDKAIWWTEYVIRHKGARHFWHPNLDIPLYQYLLLDVISFVLFVFMILSYILYKIARSLCSLITRNKKEKTS